MFFFPVLPPSTILRASVVGRSTNKAADVARSLRLRTRFITRTRLIRTSGLCETTLLLTSTGCAFKRLHSFRTPHNSNKFSVCFDSELSRADCIYRHATFSARNVCGTLSCRQAIVALKERGSSASVKVTMPGLSYNMEFHHYAEDFWSTY